MPHTYNGLTCYRRKGRVIIEIPEIDILKDCKRVIEPTDAEISVRNRDGFFDELVARIPEIEHDSQDSAESRLRYLVRGAAYMVAENGISAKYFEF